jgi:hypothetical protein
MRKGLGLMERADLRDSALRYWTISRAWNGHPTKARLTAGGCITACNKILSKTNPERVIAKRVGVLLHAIVHDSDDKNAATGS